MAKWLDKYDAPKAQNGIEGTMGGLTDKGFNYNGAWGGPSMQMGGNIQPPMAGADQTVPMYQMGGYVYPTTFVPQAGMGTLLPGSVGFTYARTKGIPSEGPYGKKTVPSAQDGRTLLGTLSNFIPYYETYLDVKDAIMGGLTGDRARMNQGIFGLGSPSFSGKALTSSLDYLTEKGLGKNVADYNEAKRNDITNMSQRDRQKLFEKYGAGGYDKWVKAGKPKLQNGGEMQFYQNGLDWTPRNISEYGSEIPMAQPGITQPMRGDIQTRGNQNLLTEIAAQRTKEKKAQEARTKTTIGADTRTAKQKEKDRKAYESKVKYEKEVLGKDFETPQYLQEKNRARAEHLLHLADVGSMGAGLVEGIGKLALKNVPKPKSTFKSEVDWAKWNPETPTHKVLMDEYNAIEESTKKAGTWMKNPDGSSFQGTPEQFIQQQSSYFKKAFGDSKLVNPDGSPTIQYHGSAKKFDIFDESKFQLGDAGYSGRGIYTTPSKAKAESYALSSKSIHKNGNYEPTVYELYGRGNNPISAEDLIKQKKEYDLFNFHRQKDWRGDVPLEEQLLDYDVAIRNQTRGIERVSPWYQADELVFPTNKQLKSAVGNVGFFDMTNPNIYKAIVPAAIGTTALGAIEQKKKGGVVKDNDGYWNPENWGKVVEIDSPNITMKGVNQDLIGVSDEGDVQYMTPGNDYKFKGEKVKEYPVGKYGVNQQDEKTVQHLDQLLNFTNKPKAKNGWLSKYE